MTVRDVVRGAVGLVPLIASSSGAVGCAPRPAVPAADLAVVGVTVLPMEGELRLEDQTVVVSGDRIVAMGPSGDMVLPDGVETVSGAGRFLMPGLTEMHGHLPGANAPEALAEDILMLYAANGVTAVRGMQGHPRQLGIRDRIAAGDLLGPRLFVGSPAMSGRIASPDEARRLVGEYAAAGFDLLKVHEGLAPDAYAAIAEAAGEAGIPFAGHVSDAVGLEAAFAAGQDTVDHLDNYLEELLGKADRGEVEALRGIADLVERVDRGRIPDVVAATVAADAAVVPTMVLWESGIFPVRPAAELLAERPAVRYMPKETVERWTEAVDGGLGRYGAEATREVAAIRREILGALVDVGARILLGTDSPQIFSVPGFSIHAELAAYVEAGMTPLQALRSGTRAVSAHMARGGRIADDFGVVGPGKRADLVLLEADPTEDIAATRRIAGVVVAGRYLSADDIRDALAAVAARRASGN